MAISFPDTRQHLDELAVNFLWRQWSSIGVAGGARSSDAWMIDPEALVLATSRYGRRDPRLMDESLDWLVRNGLRINVLRLRSLDEEWPGIADGRVLAAISGILGKQSVLRKWRGLGRPASPDAEPEPLFYSAKGGYLPVLGEPDPAFQAAGLLRGPVEHRGMSKAPDARMPGNLIFLLRSLFGVNARAEIFAWLLVHGSGNPTAIARDTGYFFKSVQLTLNELEESCQILSSRQGREKIYRVIADSWHFLLAPHGSAKDERIFPVWLDWMPVFAILTRLAETLSIPGLDEKSESFQAIKFRDALDSLKPAIDRVAVAHGWRTTTDLRGADLIQSLLADLDSLLG
jgi:hypothetical protein